MIKTIQKLTLAATATLLLVACSETPKTADYYMKNTHEQAVVYTQCQQRPETLKTPNCVAAIEAEALIKQGVDAIKKYQTENK
jgi:uncharacterized lipoprotein YmbA